MASRGRKMVAMATINSVESEDLEEDALLKIVDSFLAQNNLDTEIDGAESDTIETNLAVEKILCQEDIPGSPQVVNLTERSSRNVEQEIIVEAID